MISVTVKAQSHYTKYVEICYEFESIMSHKSSLHTSSLKYNNLIYIWFHKDSFFKPWFPCWCSIMTAWKSCLCSFRELNSSLGIQQSIQWPSKWSAKNHKVRLKGLYQLVEKWCKLSYHRVFLIYRAYDLYHNTSCLWRPQDHPVQLGKHTREAENLSQTEPS